MTINGITEQPAEHFLSLVMILLDIDLRVLKSWAWCVDQFRLLFLLLHPLLLFLSHLFSLSPTLSDHPSLLSHPPSLPISLCPSQPPTLLPQDILPLQEHTTLLTHFFLDFLINPYDLFLRDQDQFPQKVGCHLGLLLLEHLGGLVEEVHPEEWLLVLLGGLSGGGGGGVGYGVC